MKRILAACALAVCFICFFAPRAYAYTDKTTQDIAHSTGASQIETEHLNNQELNGEKRVNLFQKVWQIITQSLKGNLPAVTKSAGLILCMLILCCVMHALKFDNSQALDTAVGFISVLVLSATAYSVLYNLFVLVKAAMETVSLTMASLLPTMAALYSYGGSVAAGATSVSGLSVFLSILSLICTKVLLPLLQICFALALTGALPNGINLSAVTHLVKTTATTLLGFAFTLLSFLLYFQTTVAAASDNFVARSVRFASGNFIPIIGGVLGDASRTVAASVSVIKGTVGTAGVVLVLSSVLPMVILTLLYKLVFSFSAAAAKSLGCDRESVLLYDLSGILSILLALTIGAGCVCIIGLAVFVKVGVQV